MAGRKGCLVHRALRGFCYCNHVYHPLCDDHSPFRVFFVNRHHLMKTWLIIINNFVHDLFTGLWISTVLVIYLLGRKAGFAQGTSLATSLQEVMKVFFWLGVFSILVIIITGIFRLREYRSKNSGASEPIKNKLLILKHILLGGVFLAGTYLAYIRAFC